MLNEFRSERNDIEALKPDLLIGIRELLDINGIRAVNDTEARMRDVVHECFASLVEHF